MESPETTRAVGGDADGSELGCRNCGHALSGQDCCSNCGLPLVVSLGAPGALAVDEQGVVVADTICRKCGYNLRGLQRDSRCPECASPIAVSLRGDLLCFSEPGYVRRLARGNLWILRGLTLAVLCWLLLIVGVLVISLSGSGWLPPSVPGMAVFGLGTLGGLAGALVFLWGVWCLTVAEPGVYDTSRRDTARRLVRVYMLVTILGLALSFVLDEIVPPMRVMAAFEIFSLSFSVLGVVATAAYFLYVRGVAQRIPQERLGRRAGSLAKSLAVVLGVLVLFGAVDTIARWGPALVRPATPTTIPAVSGAPSPPPTPVFATPWEHVKNCVSGVAYLAVLVLFLRAVRLHHFLRKPLKQQATLASKHWRSAAAEVR